MIGHSHIEEAQESITGGSLHSTVSLAEGSTSDAGFRLPSIVWFGNDEEVVHTFRGTFSKSERKLLRKLDFLNARPPSTFLPKLSNHISCPSGVIG